MIILKAILIISAFLTVSLRLLVTENAEFLGQELANGLNIVGFVSAGVCLISALIWIILLKKEEKNKKEKENNEE